MPVFTRLQGNIRRGSSLSQICIGIHLPCRLLVLLRDFSSSCVITWEQLYRNLFCSPCLGGFQVPCPGFFIWGCFSGENLYCFPPSANLLSCPNSLFSISFIGKALHGSCIDVWQNLVCFWVPGQPPHASLSWELQGLSFFWTLTLSLSPREERSMQSKAGRVIWSSVLGAIAIQLVSKLKIEGKLLSEQFWSVATFYSFLLKW